ncbi:MAG: YbjQ family protein [Leptospirales bacterium]|nr:YbjQ family protein [Leptospirales bacterium]
MDTTEEIINGVIIATGDINKEFETIDNVFAMNTIFAGIDPNTALEKVKQDIAAKCLSLGGNAVLNYRFEYRTPDPPACFGIVDIYAYGTVVKTG